MLQIAQLVSNRARARAGGALSTLQSCGADVAQELLTRLGMKNVIYIVGLIVVVAAVLSFFGLR